MTQVTIKCRHEDFSNWVECGLKFIGSGTYQQSGATFILNVSGPHRYEMLRSMLKAWSKGYSEEWLRINHEKLNPFNLYTIQSKQLYEA